MVPVEIICVQPGCARKTRDFYRVDNRIAAESSEVAHGATCSDCFEKLVARETRTHAPPKTQPVPHAPQ